jgi:two-component system cell cycle sensor histidine kinase/response regulator CckA
MTDLQNRMLAWMRERAFSRTAPPPNSGIRVLIVDDEESVRRFVARALDQAGFQTHVAADGPEALAAATASHPFDVILTDLVMPQMTGDEVVRRLRTQWPELKVLYLTGHSDRLFDDRSALWADEAFLDKPCSVKALLQALSLLVFSRIDVATPAVPEHTGPPADLLPWPDGIHRRDSLD